MRNTITSLFFFCVFVMHAQQTPQGNVVNDYFKKQNFNGVVLVATDGKIDYLSSKGLSDRQTKTPITTKTKFKIASVTKAFTAILVMKLYEQGKIDLNASIGQYFPNYKGEGKDKVLIRHLLTYASGIENGANPMGAKPYLTQKSLDEFIGEYCSGKLVEVPGQKSVYGNTEYIILQKIIENVSQKSYAALLQEVILDPLGMINTGVINSDKIKKSLTKTYTYDDKAKTFEADKPFFIENYFAAGNMYSTAEDLLLLSNALFGNKILSETTTQKMLEIHPDLGYTAYGLWGSDGWGTFDEKFYYRTGGIMGSTANWIHTIGTRKTIIVLSNTDATNLYELSERLYLAGKK